MEWTSDTNTELTSSGAGVCVRVCVCVYSKSDEADQPAELNSVSGRLVTLNLSKSRVYLLRDREPVGLSEIRSAGIAIRTGLIGRTDFDTTTSIPNPTLSLCQVATYDVARGARQADSHHF